MSRTMAQGIFNLTAKIPRSEAKPFTGTYDSSGPVLHLGIYVGENMMLHSASGNMPGRTANTGRNIFLHGPPVALCKRRIRLNAKIARVNKEIEKIKGKIMGFKRSCGNWNGRKPSLKIWKL